MGIEFERWDTPLCEECVELLEVRYLWGNLDLELYTEGLRYKRVGKEIPPSKGVDLSALVFDLESESVYSVQYSGVLAHRVLDEGGLTDLWAASAVSPRPHQTTFRVRGHGWCCESPLVFLDDCWSYMIATDDDCLEVVAKTPPCFLKLETIPKEYLSGQKKGSGPISR